MRYEHSPKALVIAGPPAAGKSTLAARLRDELGYAPLNLDTVNVEVAGRLGLTVPDLRQPQPAVTAAFKDVFLRQVREQRYANLLLEGSRVSHPHIFDAFRHALFSAYGEYAILSCFYLNPDEETRQRQYLLRQAQLAKQAAKYRDPQALSLLKHEYEKGFCTFLEQPLPGFVVVDSAEDVLARARELQNARHPDLPDKYGDLIRFIAESGAYNPFYQRVEVEGTVVIHGFTDSQKSWANIRAMGVDLAGKTALDIGCMHGYYTFKLEEAGAAPLGVDIDAHSIDVAREVARARGSKARFAAANSEDPFTETFDVVFALNVLHRVSDFRAVCENIFTSCSQAVVEVGEVQLPELFALSAGHGFKRARSLKSHRSSDVVGQRVLVHLVKAG
ncbi:Ubiquinone biosynthesis O-methyltransferase [Fundidesulfovibrio magnetotacticus]|uniref:Ubiquinone biosynthesis O-methyltransferase n=1 Tax=Fundidesulfovibrio magnetotacticus TaxID=2730080 RepID=A0A6V8M2M3_9BACT|nr:methyltransferase [Fundidesulfovibrio magnetotacticus]GFK96067.1 Ubiquinone biosynthesis O-methyltransferase [Fundidesulfovibrio magnetotacticus]